MVWQKFDKDGKPRFIKKFGNLVVMTKDKNGALDSIPEGWTVVRLSNGHLKLMRR